MNIYQSNTNRKDFSWLYMATQGTKSLGEAANEGPAIIHTCFCSLSNIYIQVEARSTSPTTVFQAKLLAMINFIKEQYQLCQKEITVT